MSKPLRITAAIIFGAYVLLMLWLLFGQRLGYSLPGSYGERLALTLNLVPGRTVGQFIAMAADTSAPAAVRHAVVNLAGNVVMFIPLGFFLPCLWPRLRSLGRFLLTTVAVIIAIEIVQLLTLLGSCDIDDLILNTLGALIGWALLRLAARRPWQRQRDDHAEQDIKSAPLTIDKD